MSCVDLYSQLTLRSTKWKAIHNATLPAEGSGAFNNVHLAILDLAVPWFVQRMIPFKTGWKTYWFLFALFFVPLTIGYWIITSRFGPRKNERTKLPNRPLSEYYTIKDRDLAAKYEGKKMPMQVFHDAYFEGKIDFNGDVLDVMEQRHDWSLFELTPENFRYVLFNLIPDVIFHTQKQDEDQIRDNYDRGDDFYSWFLGPRMIYTSGVIRDINREETLEELQDNKLNMVCEKLDLQPGDRMLDIGCGWGTLIAHAAKNYGADVTGVTVAQTGAAFAERRLRENGVPESQGRVLCMDYREIPNKKGYYNKISCLEMAEHVGLRRYSTFLKELYDLLDDDGVLVFQVAGLRKQWQFEDLIWGIFMNKYVFPGADASKNLGWVIEQLEGAGFEVKSIDVLGVHYSATIWQWYKNWLSNRDKVVAKYGERWFRIWAYFLAYSVIVARQGSSSVFQITLHKNLNAFDRCGQIPTHAATQAPVRREIKPVESHREFWPEMYGGAGAAAAKPVAASVPAPAASKPAATAASAEPTLSAASTAALGGLSAAAAAPKPAQNAFATSDAAYESKLDDTFDPTPISAQNAFAPKARAETDFAAAVVPDEVKAVAAEPIVPVVPKVEDAEGAEVKGSAI